jgi:hypothetical protein
MNAGTKQRLDAAREAIRTAIRALREVRETDPEWAHSQSVRAALMMLDSAGMAVHDTRTLPGET